MAITSRPAASEALVCIQAPRTRSSTSGLTRPNARRKVDSSAGPRAAPSPASTSGPASAAHWPIAANDRAPAATAAIPTASSPASGCRRPRHLRGFGTWARRSRTYWLHAAAVMGEDGIGGRASLGADDGKRENFHRSARTPPATRRHAGHITLITTPQVTPSLHDFAGSLATARTQFDVGQLADDDARPPLLLSRLLS
jgi:hypothetical protein